MRCPYGLLTDAVTGTAVGKSFKWIVNLTLMISDLSNFRRRRRLTIDRERQVRVVYLESDTQIKTYAKTLLGLRSC
jgi:hypothetical protein